MRLRLLGRYALHERVDARVQLLHAVFAVGQIAKSAWPTARLLRSARLSYCASICLSVCLPALVESNVLLCHGEILPFPGVGRVVKSR